MTDDAGIIFREFHKCVCVCRMLIPVWKSMAEKVLDTIHKCTSFQLKKWRSAHPQKPVGKSPYYTSSLVFLRFSGYGFEFSPVKSTLAVLKWILLSVFAKHFGSHCLKHTTVQQCLAHTHHFWPRHTCTYNFNQTIVHSRKINRLKAVFSDVRIQTASFVTHTLQAFESFYILFQHIHSFWPQETVTVGLEV